MIINAAKTDLPASLRADVVVIGAGPAGIVTALELARSGVDVLLVESGLVDPSDETQLLSEAELANPELHSPMSITTSRRLGGASAIWGGRCVPYDPIDFDERTHVPQARWPVTYEEISPYFGRACEWMVCGRPAFSIAETPHLPPRLVPNLPDGDVSTSSLERWSLPTHFGHVYRDQLRASGAIRTIVGLTCTALLTLPGSPHAQHARCRTLDGRRVDLNARMFVVASGGLESTRLLLNSTAADGTAMGNQSDHLGRWYMGHAEGVIANIRLSGDSRDTIFDYERDVDGVYVRRRFSFSREFQHAEGLPNIVAWLANPELPDADHHSGPLSLAYLMLASPLGGPFASDAQRRSLTGDRIPGSPYGGASRSSVRAHLRNIAGEPLATARFIASFGVRRFLTRGRKAAGFFVRREDNVYPFQFHGEHLPHADSRVRLTDEHDAVGMPRLSIDVRFTDEDVDGVVRAHQHWDRYLRETGAGRLDYLHDDIRTSVWKRLGAGFHQIGTTRMSACPDNGVVDRNLAVHNAPNVFVASSSSFPTSSQANSTLMIVAFAARLADHIAGILHERVEMYRLSDEVKRLPNRAVSGSSG